MIAKIVNDTFSMQNTPGGQRLALALATMDERYLNCVVYYNLNIYYNGISVFVICALC
jgi:hypothetical protein